MTKLSDTQALILSAAAQRPEHIALPLPESLRGGAAAKVVGAMLAKGFLQEVDADMRKGEPVWRETGDGHGVTLVATDAGLAAIGIETAGDQPQQRGLAGTVAPDHADPVAGVDDRRGLVQQYPGSDPVGEIFDTQHKRPCPKGSTVSG